MTDKYVYLDESVMLLWAKLISFIFIFIYLTILPVSQVCTHEADIPNDFIQIGNSATASNFSLLLALT
jgi:hypothetical protein